MSQNKVFLVTGQNWQAIVVDHLPDGTNLNGKLIPLCYANEINVADVLDAFCYDMDEVVIVPVEYAGTVHELLSTNIWTRQLHIKPMTGEVKHVPSGNVSDVSFDTNVTKYNDVFKEQGLDIDVPNVGDEIYVDPQRTAFTNITGGKAKVAHVHAGKPMLVPSAEDSDDDAEEEQYVVTYFLEVEELPGVFLNWSLLIPKQAQLREQFGNQYASLENE
mgnify:CR=1 FL=1